ncbi:hypothetical protein [Shimia sp.]
MQTTRQTQTAHRVSGAFSKFVADETQRTPGVVRLVRGFEESTLFRDFSY